MPWFQKQHETYRSDSEDPTNSITCCLALACRSDPESERTFSCHLPSAHKVQGLHQSPMSFQLQPMQEVPVAPTILGTSKYMPSSLHQDASLGSHRSKASSHDNSLSSSSVFEPGSVFDSPDGDCLLLADGISSGNACNPPAAELVSFMLDQAAAAGAPADFNRMGCPDSSDPSLRMLLFPTAEDTATLELPSVQDNTMRLTPFLCQGPPLPQSSINNPSALRDLAASQHKTLQAAAAGAGAEANTRAAAAASEGMLAGGGASAAMNPVLVPVPLPPTAAAGATGAPGRGPPGSAAQEQLQVYRLMVLDEETGAPIREATFEESLELEEILQESKVELLLRQGKGGPSWLTGSDQQEAAAAGEAAKGGKQSQERAIGEGAVEEDPCCVKGPSQEQKEQQEEGEASEGAAAKPVLVRTFSSKCGGPCDHCGVKGEAGAGCARGCLACRAGMGQIALRCSYIHSEAQRQVSRCIG
jgi:hypothetical protein